MIEVSHITKIFPDGTKALDDVSFNVNDGELVVVAGSNGSGKSVLMSIIAKLDEPTSGSISFCEMEEKRVGLIFQDADSQIMGETPAEDVAFGLYNMGYSKIETAEKVDKALHTVGLDDKKEAMARFMSGGEKRRLAVASMLALKRDILVFDEPFANLDWPGVRQVCNILADLKKNNKTVIVLTHELEKILSLADKLIVLDHGVIRFNGKPTDGLSTDLSIWGIRNPLVKYGTCGDCFWGDK